MKRVMAIVLAVIMMFSSPMQLLATEVSSEPIVTETETVLETGTTEVDEIVSEEAESTETIEATEVIQEEDGSSEQTTEMEETAEVEETTEIITEVDSEIEEIEVEETEVEDAEEMEDTVIEDAEDVVKEASGVGITRIQWLQSLTKAYGMSVEEENYPDDYFTDIDASYAYYYDVMLATEFGLVDVEAGDAFLPDAPATREFVAHTLNICMGYTLENKAYTFAEAAAVTYPDDIQIAINNGWFTLTEGAFLPGQQVTTTEQAILIGLASQDAADRLIDATHSNQYQLQSDVIIIPQNVVIELVDDETYTLSQVLDTFAVGSKIAFVNGELPIVKRVLSIVVNNGTMTITTESVAMEEAFVSIDYEGTTEGNLANVKAFNEDVKVSYVVGGTVENEYEDGKEYHSAEGLPEDQISAVKLVQEFDISPKVAKEFDIAEGVKATITCTISNPGVDYKVKTSSPYVNFYSTVTFSCNVSMDVLEAINAPSNIELAKVPVGYIGYIKATLKLSASGEATVSLVENVSMGVKYSNANGFQMTRKFTKKEFTIQARAQANAGVKLTAGFDIIVLKGDVYGEVGANATASFDTYDDGKLPLSCTHVQAHLYAKVGCGIKLDIVVIKKEHRDEYVIYDKKNSPVKVALHYEDEKYVTECTRDGNGTGSGSGSGQGSGSTNWPRFKYYTPATSRYAYNGSTGGVGSNGELFTIFEYEKIDESNIRITKYNGSHTSISIPKTLDGYTVQEIGSGVFNKNKQLRMVVIPDTVIRISDKAFAFCTSLSSVILSNNLEELGYHAFYDCDSLTNIHIPKSLKLTTSLGTTANRGPFNNCNNLKTVTFEEGITKIPKMLFANCPGLENITIPDTVTTIEEYAFYNCENLKDIKFSSKLTAINTGAFLGNTSLKEIKIPNSVKTISDNAFSACTNITSLTLSNNLTALGYNAFYNCDGLTSIHIPKSLTSTTTLSTESNRGPFNGCDNLKTVTFEEGITKIANDLFANCTGLESITIPETVTVIGAEAFYKCVNLKVAKIPSKLTTIEDAAFKSCEVLEEATLPNSVTAMGTQVFAFTNLKSYVLPNKLTSVSASTFSGCENLAAVEIPDTVEIIRANAFQNAGVTTVVFPENLKTIEKYAFQNCDKLKTVVANNNLTTIATYAFQDCDALTDITLKDSVTSIAVYAFNACDNLANVSLGRGLTKIEGYTFADCPKIVDFVVPYNVTSISANAFKNDTGLETITIPQKTTSINSGAFSYPGSMTVYGVAGSYAETFANANGIRFVNKTVPATSVSLPQTEYRIARYKTMTLTPTIAPTDFTDLISYKSSDTKVATVTEDGVVKGVGLGTATITVTVGAKSASCKVKVVEKLEITYNIAFKGNGSTSGSMSTLKNCDSQKEYTLPANAYTRKGYTFTGWNTKADGKGTSYKDKAQVIGLATEDGKTITLYAQWKLKSYKITYVLDNGKNNSANPANYNMKSKTITLKNPTRTGYTFKGWYSDSAKTKKVTEIKTGSTGDKKFYAKWSANKYNIKFNANGGSGTMSTKSNVSYTTKVKLTNKFTRTGYTFAGWATSASGSVKYKNNEEVSKLTSTNSKTVTLYAKWTVNKYNIKYDANGGTGTMSTKKDVKYTDKVTLTANKFTRKGYTFEGWATSKDGSVKYKDKASVSKLTSSNAKTVTLYAKWKKNTYKLTYNVNGGKLSSSAKKTYTVTDSTFTLAKPTKTGYTFGGWYTDKACKGTKVTKIEKGTTGNKTLYAKWTVNKYNIKFNANGGTGTMSTKKDVKYTDTVTLAANKFTRKGYTFQGWATSKNGKVVYKNKAKVSKLTSTNGKTVTLYAVWEKK